MEETNAIDEAMSALKEEMLKELAESVPYQPALHDPLRDNND